MREDFSNVSEERLSELFPVILEPYNPEWPVFYSSEKELLESVFGEKILRISHIGSTSVCLSSRNALHADIRLLKHHLPGILILENWPETWRR
jgi:GrpB-like predicted nucleotidyltransferase (UPF0157 family)